MAELSRPRAPRAPRARRPAPDELARAVGATVPDVVGNGLQVLFCGINPGLWSGAVGHHFAHPGNRFWKAIAAAGFTEEVLRPEEESRLPEFGVGITNLVAVATRAASDLSRDQLRDGAWRLQRKVRRLEPRAVVFLGVVAYRAGFERPAATIGRQPETIDGTALWVVANPSGLQAHYPFGALVDQLREVRSTVI